MSVVKSNVNRGSRRLSVRINLVVRRLTQFAANQKMKYFKTLAVLLLLSLVTVGCTDPKMQSEPSDPVPQSNTNSDGQNDGVVKIAVLTDGTVIVNSEVVPIESLASKLNTIGDIKVIWYYREAPDAAEPHENAMKTIAEIANRKLPIAMYLDRGFTQRATFGE